MTAPQNPPPPQNQPQPSGQPIPPPQGVYPVQQGVYQVPQGGAVAAPAPPKISFFEAIKPEPSKAPPLEWVALVVSIILAISGLLPWISDGTNTVNGLDSNLAGNGWIMLGAGLGAAILGFFGLSRDSISLAVGQAILGIIALIFAIIDLSPGAGFSASFGVILAIVTAVIVIILSAYNAYDAVRKGAKY